MASIASWPAATPASDGGPNDRLKNSLLVAARLLAMDNALIEAINHPRLET